MTQEKWGWGAALVLGEEFRGEGGGGGEPLTLTTIILATLFAGLVCAFEEKAASRATRLSPQ